jgi:hypothetical protein
MYNIKLVFRIAPFMDLYGGLLYTFLVSIFADFRS